MSTIIVVIEHDRGVIAETATQAITFAQALNAAGLGDSVTAAVVGAEGDGVAAQVAASGVAAVVQLHHSDLLDYAPEAWGDALAQLAVSHAAAAVVAVGTDRGNEILAHVAAVNDVAFAANVAETGSVDGDALRLTRVRWGGALLENAMLACAPGVALSCAAYTYESAASESSPAPVSVFQPELGDAARRTRITDRVTLASGITLTTAAVVVSGGRGVGSAEGFAPLEELADLLGGAVGCSRVATNNGWRPHSDQVGQTGKRIAPELYIACGISGATQHWVGMMASKKVLAINTDGEANMVGKADYAVIGDLHAVLPAVSAEIRRRRG